MTDRKELSGCMNLPPTDAIDVQVNWCSEEFNSVIKYSEEVLGELLQYRDNKNTFPLTIGIPVTKWVYPKWVWWTPKVEAPYRFLGIGHEETIHEEYFCPDTKVVSVSMDDDNMIHTIFSGRFVKK